MSLPVRLQTPDLRLEPPAGDAPARPAAAADAEEVRAIRVRSSARHAGWIWVRHGVTGIELAPDHRRRGRGTEAMSVWFEALHGDGHTLALPALEHPAVRAFCRAFGLQPMGDRWEESPRSAERLSDLRHAQLRRYRQRVHMSLLELGAPGDYGEALRLPVVAEARALVSIGLDVFEREQFLAPPAAAAWQRMAAAAGAAGVALQPVSGFRGFDDQLAIIQRKRERGQPLREIVTVSALPGYSEHHSGGALDVTTPGAPVLEEAFEATAAYRWLLAHAGTYGFRQSYPRDNPHGIAFEPWHWCHADTADAASLGRAT